jgi:two-component system chemotaxis sensor kinase CheA
MSSPGAVAVELKEVALRLADLAAGNVDALRDLQPVLHRLVASPALSGAVKTLVVQAILLLDDPRVAAGHATGASLVSKTRLLLESALSAHASNNSPTAFDPGAESMRLEFSPDALVSPELDRGLVDDFVAESREQLAMAESALLALDADPDDSNALEVMFRALHTIKGTSAFIGIEHITELAHHAESMLDRVRSGAAVCSGELSNLLFRSIDMLDSMLASIDAVQHGEVAMIPRGYRELVRALRTDLPMGGYQNGAPRVSGSVQRVRAAEAMVRIRASDLDRLVSTVRELVLTHSMVSRDTTLRSGALPDLSRKIAHAESLVFELDDLANSLRNVAIASTMQKLARIARDAAYSSGKSIELLMTGEDVLVERATAEALADPLMHMVRNAIDHGIESVDERLRAGKSPSGILRIAAHRLGAELVIELADDGRGLDPQRLMRAAAERGIIPPTAALTNDEAYALIFRPGFTTATIVTGLSGRGVGMDVVRSSVEALGGSVDIRSHIGKGTTFAIRLPFRTQPQRAERNSPVDTWGEPPRVIGKIA